MKRTLALLGWTLACTPRAVTPVSETPTPTVAEALPPCPKLASENPLDTTAGRFHVQSPAPLSCPAVVDPRGELLAVCAGRGVAVLDLQSGREILHVPARANAWGWDSTGALLVARNGENFVEVDRIEPRALDRHPEQRATIEVSGDAPPSA
jgi:hypothetical protein